METKEERRKFLTTSAKARKRTWLSAQVGVSVREVFIRKAECGA